MDAGVEAFIAGCRELAAQYEAMGFETVIFLTHHQAGNIGELIRAGILQHTAYGAYRRYGEGWWTREAGGRGAEIPVRPATLDTGFFGGHGGKGETEAVMALCLRLAEIPADLDAEPWWNRTAPQAEPQNAERELEVLAARWKTLIGGLYEKRRQERGKQND